jgi:hypothetical protein
MRLVVHVACREEIKYMVLVGIPGRKKPLGKHK